MEPKRGDHCPPLPKKVGGAPAGIGFRAACENIENFNTVDRRNPRGARDEGLPSVSQWTCKESAPIQRETARLRFIVAGWVRMPMHENAVLSRGQTTKNHTCNLAQGISLSIDTTIARPTLYRKVATSCTCSRF